MPQSSDSDPDIRATGGGLCRAVRYELTGELRDVVLCHCEMCRRSHGHVAAYTAVAKAGLRMTESRGLKWYRSSPRIRRGFCSECGATLFWDAEERASISVAAGSVDPPTGLKTALQIHVASAGDYYDIDPDVPQRMN